ncbi:hypothetical protein ABTE96_20405, partial [Acinetobacter baumannii]
MVSRESVLAVPAAFARYAGRGVEGKEWSSSTTRFAASCGEVAVAICGWRRKRYDEWETMPTASSGATPAAIWSAVAPAG